jgi:hypothetical protein
MAYQKSLIGAILQNAAEINKKIAVNTLFNLQNSVYQQFMENHQKKNPVNH